MALNNRLGIESSAELAREEERISKKKALEMFESGYLDTLNAGTFEALSLIHKFLFDEIYDFAGKIREVNISKGNFRFAPLMYLKAALENIDRMPQSTFDEIVEKYVEMNIAHPFREGNGRATRIWLDLIFKNELGKVVDWSLIDKEDYLLAMERSPVKDIEIKHILENALTDETDNREVFMKGIDHSYFYEGYVTFKTEELTSENTDS
ncbi:MAG: Fic family protein [Clostridia bacterium]|nr:Fic family protein [Clostridia bacterium]